MQAFLPEYTLPENSTQRLAGKWQLHTARHSLLSFGKYSLTRWKDKPAWGTLALTREADYETDQNRLYTVRSNRSLNKRRGEKSKLGTLIHL